MYLLNVILMVDLAIMLTKAVCMSQIGTRMWLLTNYEEHEYIFPKKEWPIETELYVVRALGSFYLLFNLLIPLDLAINIVIVKMFYTLYMEVDVEFVDFEKSIEQGEGNLIGCNVRNMVKLEDVAQIDHIFCDKTGTLTQNILIFKHMAFGDKVFSIEDSNSSSESKSKFQ